MDCEAATEKAMQKPKVPRIDFSGVEPQTAAWDSVRSQVMRAFESHGCFEAVHDAATPELRNALPRDLATQLFTLPLETKLKNSSEKLYYGYVGQIPGLASESLVILDPLLPHGVPNFASLMWPDGNPGFCEAASLFASKLRELEETVMKMLLEGLRLDQYHAQLMSESTWFSLRVLEYGAPGQQGSAVEGDKEEEEEEDDDDGQQGEDDKGKEKKKRMLGFKAHRDTTILAIICQLNGVHGLQVETKDGHWILAKPSPTSLIVVAGVALRAWTNGRVYAPLHRIVVESTAKSPRYSAVLFSHPKEEFLVQAPPALVDENHPARYKPYFYPQYLSFLKSEKGEKDGCKLDAFIGAEEGEA